MTAECRAAGFKFVLDVTSPDELLDYHGRLSSKLARLDRFTIIIPDGGEDPIV